MTEITCIVDYWNGMCSSRCTTEFHGHHCDKYSANLQLKLAVLYENYNCRMNENIEKTKELLKEAHSRSTITKLLTPLKTIKMELCIKSLQEECSHYLKPSINSRLEIIQKFLSDEGFSLKNASYPRLYKKID